MRHLPALLAAVAAILAVAIASPVPASAEEEVRGMQLAFHEGRYDEAASRAARVETADARAFAARALLAKAVCGEGEPPATLLLRARALAEEAVALEPGHAEGRLQLAIARSLIARALPARRAMAEGREARALAEAVLADAPGNAYAHGFLAIWHLEVIRRGGGLGAAWMGADLVEARSHYRLAVAARPGDAAIHWQYARALAAIDLERFSAEIAEALAAARRAPLEGDVETVMAMRADRLASLMEGGSPQRAAAYASARL